jgi:hypothetical protein
MVGLGEERGTDYNKEKVRDKETGRGEGIWRRKREKN